MSKENLEKLMAVFGVVLLTLVVVVFFYNPGMYTTDKTEIYCTYNAIKDYTEISELEKYLEENNIRSKTSVGDIYVYPDSHGEYEFQFITLGDACEIVPSEFAINFQKIDKKEDVEIEYKKGKEYIYRIESGKRYVYSEGRYYITIARLNLFKIVRVIISIIVALVDILIIYVAFFYRKKEHKRSSK